MFIGLIVMFISVHSFSEMAMEHIRIQLHQSVERETGNHKTNVSSEKHGATRRRRVLEIGREVRGDQRRRVKRLQESSVVRTRIRQDHQDAWAI